jgi:hemerythrin-like metal-binding protein
MPVFEWSEKLSTGIAKIDEQHVKLVGLVNALADAMRAGKGKDLIGAVLGELKGYTEYHFGFEEAAFAKYGFPGAAAHAKAHADLVGRLDDLEGKYSRGVIGISIDILDFLIEWVKGHIMKEDMEYVPFLKGKAL